MVSYSVKAVLGIDDKEYSEIMPTVRTERLIFPCRTVTVLTLGCMLTMW